MKAEDSGISERHSRAFRALLKSAGWSRLTSRLACRSSLYQHQVRTFPSTMAGVRRQIFNLLVALSLLLCVAAMATWVISHHVGVDRSVGWVTLWRHGQARLAAGTHGGSVGFSWERNSFMSVSPTIVDAGSWHLGPVSVMRGHERASPQVSGGWVNFDCWFVCAATAVLPALHAPMLMIGVYRRRRRRATGRCTGCGYDLRATPDRCPECGTAALAVSR